MIRAVFEILLPLILPTALYLGWISLLRWASGSDAALLWATMPWLWLAATGLALLAGFLIVVNVGFGPSAGRGTYVPARLVNGHIVPGHIEPDRSP